ncbi:MULTISPECIES: hypothetical protein [unclassified Variovorax]|uniref:hypothetical protein n=1 Tax=unclassified Variovorax TaxID=663243 RepID=UPI0008AAC4F3|nr:MULTISPECIES: hypothetical protein [unclassified Variovorax]SEK16589.1 hypothetical protein SAMN05518853_12761 [Variovorax sp. OK202]SFE53425.1 hypothetical protein SAMN05444746_12761 [Variovorax sp. OK212]
MENITQTPVRFGAGEGLFGMLTSPRDQTSSPTACLMFNMGANHRVGPRRINVKLAHALAAEGVSSMRFDLGGIGDSQPLKMSRSVQARAVHCIKAAMDVAQEQLGARQFVIVAMCSGVAQSMQVAVEDPRVIGLSLFDGFSFPEWRARLQRNVRRAFAVSWHPAFRGKAVRWLRRRFTNDEANTPMPDIFPEEISRDESLIRTRQQLQQLVDRRVGVQLLYSGSLCANDRGLDQLGLLAREPFAHLLDYRFMRDVDHTVCTASGQQIFLKTVGNWVTDRAFKGEAGQCELARGLTEAGLKFSPGLAVPSQ